MNTRFLGILVTVGLSFSAFANAGTPLDIASEDSLVVDNFADGDYTSNLGKWVFPNDNGDGGGSTVKTSIVDATTNIGPAKALKLDYTLSRKKLDYEPFVEAQVSGSSHTFNHRCAKRRLGRRAKSGDEGKN